MSGGTAAPPGPHPRVCRHDALREHPLPAGTVGQNEPELPRVFLDTTYSPPTRGRLLSVGAGGDLQAALHASRPGDVIELQAGAIFTGNFILPKKPGADWIYIRSSAHALLPRPGTRVLPSHASLMPKIDSRSRAPAIRTAAGAHHYRFVGIEVTARGATRSTGPYSDNNVVYLEAEDGQTSLSQVPTDIVFDRCYVHGTATGSVRRGIAMNGARIAVVDSYLADFHEVGADSQAISGWNGPGPFKIVNNYLEGAGENLMFGGADPAIPDLVPSDIEIRRNHLFKPLSWKIGASDLCRDAVVGQEHLRVEERPPRAGGGQCARTQLAARPERVRHPVHRPEPGRWSALVRGRGRDVQEERPPSLRGRVQHPRRGQQFPEPADPAHPDPGQPARRHQFRELGRHGAALPVPLPRCSRHRDPATDSRAQHGVLERLEGVHGRQAHRRAPLLCVPQQHRFEGDTRIGRRGEELASSVPARHGGRQPDARHVLCCSRLRGERPDRKHARRLLRVSRKLLSGDRGRGRLRGCLARQLPPGPYQPVQERSDRRQGPGGGDRRARGGHGGRGLRRLRTERYASAVEGVETRAMSFFDAVQEQAPSRPASAGSDIMHPRSRSRTQVPQARGRAPSPTALTSDREDGAPTRMRTGGGQGISR